MSTAYPHAPTIARELGVSVAQVEKTVALLADGATIPFIARYRKEVTGNLDEVQIAAVDERRTYLTELEVKGETIRMVGLTGSATALLGLIAKSSSFRDVSFESSITRDPKSNRERFDIGAHIAKRGKL